MNSDSIKRFTWRSLALALLAGLLAGAVLTILLTPASKQSIRQSAEARQSILGPRTASAKSKRSALSLSDAMVNAPPKALVEAFLNKRGRDAESLISMWRLSNDQAYLREAMENFPEDALVAWTAVTHNSNAEETKFWAERLVQFDPDNAFAHWLGAAAVVKDDPAKAVDLLTNATQSPKLDAHRNEILVNQTAFFESTGMDPGEAFYAAAARLAMPHMGSLRKTAHGVIDYANELRASGDSAAADRANAVVLSLGQRLSQDSSLLIEKMVGTAIERYAIRTLDPDIDYSFLQGTVPDYTAQLDQLREENRKYISSSAEEALSIESKLSGAQQTEQIYRTVLLGERKAQEWLQKQITPPSPPAR